MCVFKEYSACINPRKETELTSKFIEMLVFLKTQKKRNNLQLFNPLIWCYYKGKGRREEGEIPPQFMGRLLHETLLPLLTIKT